MLLLLLAPVTWSGEAWPTYHGGENLAGVSTQTLPDKPVLRWRFQAGAAVYNTPVSDGTRIFFSDTKGVIYALDLNGKVLWTRSFTRTMRYSGREVPERFESPLAVFNGLVFAGAGRGTLFALKADNGETAWQAEINGILMGSPNRVTGPDGENDRVTVIDQSLGAVHAFDLEKGTPLWATEGVERCDGSAGVEGDYLAFGSCASKLHAYDARTGRHLRDIPLPKEAETAGGTAVAGASAFLGTRLGTLVHADLASGRILWTFQGPEVEAFATPAIGKDLVVASFDNNVVCGFDREHGTLRWRFATAGMPTSPVLVSGKVAVSASGFLYLLKASDGTLLWSLEVSDDITSPSVVNNLLVVGADDGTVSAFGKQPE